MTLKIDEIDNQIIIRLSDKFDISKSEEFKSAYNSSTAYEYIVDFSDTKFMDSSGLGMLLNMKRNIGDKPIKLVNCKPKIKKVLVISRFDEHFQIT